MFIAGKYTATPVAGVDGQDIQVAVDQFGNVKTVASGTAPVGGGITWGAPTAVAVTAGPTSTTLVAANAGRKGLRIWNPSGNAQMSYDLSGGVVTLALGTPLQATEMDWFTGAECPVGAVTFIGTAGQSLVYQQGT